MPTTARIALFCTHFTAILATMRIFVAGATGATGRVFVPRALAAGHDVVFHVRPQSADKSPLGKDPRARVLDLANGPALADAMAGCEVALSFVGTMRNRFKAGDTYESSDIASTRELVDGARRAAVPRFVLLSSFGAGSLGAYLQMKGKCRGDREKESGLRWTILRPSALVSPEDGAEGTHGVRRPPPGAGAVFSAMRALPGLAGFADDVRPIPIEVLCDCDPPHPHPASRRRRPRRARPVGARYASHLTPRAPQPLRMPLFQSPPRTADEVARNRPLAIGPEQVMTMNEKEWYARVYRGDAVPQLTLRAVVMGSVLGFFLAFTNLYIGLKTGWYLGVAITAVILSFSIWTTLQRLGLAKSEMSILENNCMQSCASCAGYGTGSTIITAVPALLLLTTTPTDPHGHNLPWWVIALWTLVLAGLGVTLGIPMKRSMINRERLRFPEGTAAAITLQSLFSEGRDALLKARALYLSAVVGALAPLLTGLNLVRSAPDATGARTRGPLLPDSSAIFDWLPKLRTGTESYAWSRWTMRFDHSFLLLGAGAIVGLRTSASLVLGGLILVFFVGPHALESTWLNPMGDLVAAATKPDAAWKQIGIWYGAPLMVSYGLVAFLVQGKMIARAFTGMLGRSGPNDGDADDDVSRGVEVPHSWFVVGGSVSGLAIVALGWGYFGISPLLGALAVFLSFFLTLVSARATGETSVTPMGPMGKITQLTYGILIPQNAVANLVTAGITASSSSSCADLLNDLKVGYLLGANPRRQFIAQLFGVAVGTVATTIGYLILVPDATAITGVDGAEPRFPAPGAQQWKAARGRVPGRDREPAPDGATGDLDRDRARRAPGARGARPSAGEKMAAVGDRGRLRADAPVLDAALLLRRRDARGGPDEGEPEVGRAVRPAGGVGGDRGGEHSRRHRRGGEHVLPLRRVPPLDVRAELRTARRETGPARRRGERASRRRGPQPGARSNLRAGTARARERLRAGW